MRESIQCLQSVSSVIPFSSDITKRILMSSVLSMKFTVACAKAYLQEMEMHILATCKFRLGRYLPALIPASLLRTEKSKPSHCH